MRAKRVAKLIRPPKYGGLFFSLGGAGGPVTTAESESAPSDRASPKKRLLVYVSPNKRLFFTAVTNVHRPARVPSGH